MQPRMYHRQVWGVPLARVMQRASRDKSNFEKRRGPWIDVRDWQRANFLREWKQISRRARLCAHDARNDRCDKCNYLRSIKSTSTGVWAAAGTQCGEKTLPIGAPDRRRLCSLVVSSNFKQIICSSALKRGIAWRGCCESEAWRRCLLDQYSYIF